MGIRKTEYMIEVFGGLESRKEVHKTLRKAKNRVRELLDLGLSFDIWIARHSDCVYLFGDKIIYNQLRAFDHTTNTVYIYNKQIKKNLRYVRQFDFMLRY